MQTGDARAAVPSNCPIPTARNHFFAPAVTFTDNGRAGKRVTIEKVIASFAASEGYSVLEIAAVTGEKTLWRGRAVVHEGRLTTDGELPSSLFTASTPTARASEVLYTIASKDIVIPLPASVNLDDVELTLRADAGDERVIKPPSFPAPETIADLNMQAGSSTTPCPPLNVELSRDDAPTVPYLAAILTNLDQRCAARGAGLQVDTVTFTKCARDPRGAGFGPNATATITCGK